MPELNRVLIHDDISQRYTRICLIVYGIYAVLLAVLALAVFLLHPPLPVFAVIAVGFALFSLFFIMRNPLDIFTLRVKKKMALREIIFERHAISLSLLNGTLLHFEQPKVELLRLNESGITEHFMCLMEQNGNKQNFYLGSSRTAVDTLKSLLEQHGMLLGNN